MELEVYYDKIEEGKGVRLEADRTRGEEKFDQHFYRPKRNVDIRNDMLRVKYKGNTFDTTDNILTAVTSYYQELCEDRNHSFQRETTLPPSVYRINETENDELDKDITYRDCKAALGSMKTEK